jgi:DNA-binding GntR family transcriptional regulator
LERLQASELISHETLNEKAYQRLRNALMHGQFIPGEALTIRGLAARYGISATPIREALKVLVAEGALETLPNRSLKVPMLSPQSFEELRDIRLALEGLCGERATHHIAPATITELHRLFAKMETIIADGDWTGYLHVNELFHFTVYRAARSPMLLNYIESLWLRVGPYFNFLIDAVGFSKDANAGHDLILAALDAGEPERVKWAIQADIATAAEHLLPRLRER